MKKIDWTPDKLEILGYAITNYAKSIGISTVKELRQLENFHKNKIVKLASPMILGCDYPEEKQKSVKQLVDWAVTSQTDSSIMAPKSSTGKGHASGLKYKGIFQNFLFPKMGMEK